MGPSQPKPGRLRLKGPDTAKYEVGYAKPPAATRFKPGQSGNPAGRRKGSKNRLPALHEEKLKEIILEEAYRTIRINEGEKQIKVPMAKAIVRALAVNAVKGQQRAQNLFTRLLTVTERENRRLHDAWLEVAINYKVEWERELERRQRLGLTGLPEPLPHPDHVVLDVRVGTVTIRGPATKEEKAEWDLWVSRKQDLIEELADLEQQLQDPDCEYPDQVRHEIERTRKVISILERLAAC